jgi:hypothetical protein
MKLAVPEDHLVTPGGLGQDRPSGMKGNRAVPVAAPVGDPMLRARMHIPDCDPRAPPPPRTCLPRTGQWRQSNATPPVAPSGTPAWVACRPRDSRRGSPACGTRPPIGRLPTQPSRRRARKPKKT